MTISFLSSVIAFKILVTLVAVALPFLLASRERLERLTGMTAASPLFFRLYGIAVFALLVGYASAFPTLRAGEFPWGVIIMGAISNGGASFLLMRGHTRGPNRILGVMFGGIFLALIISMASPELAIERMS